MDFQDEDFNEWDIDDNDQTYTVAPISKRTESDGKSDITENIQKKMNQQNRLIELGLKGDI